MIDCLDDRFVGLAFQPVGTVAVVRGQKTTGLLWWRRTLPVWLVKAVRSETTCVGGFIDTDRFWRTLAVFESEAAARELCASLGGADQPRAADGRLRRALEEIAEEAGRSADGPLQGIAAKARAALAA